MWYQNKPAHLFIYPWNLYGKFSISKLKKKTRHVSKVHRCPRPMAFAHMAVSFGPTPQPHPYHDPVSKPWSLYKLFHLWSLYLISNFLGQVMVPDIILLPFCMCSIWPVIHSDPWPCPGTSPKGNSTMMSGLGLDKCHTKYQLCSIKGIKVMSNLDINVNVNMQVNLHVNLNVN